MGTHGAHNARLCYSTPPTQSPYQHNTVPLATTRSTPRWYLRLVAGCGLTGVVRSVARSVSLATCCCCYCQLCDCHVATASQHSQACIHTSHTVGHTAVHVLCTNTFASAITGWFLRAVDAFGNARGGSAIAAPRCQLQRILCTTSTSHWMAGLLPVAARGQHSVQRPSDAPGLLVASSWWCMRSLLKLREGSAPSPLMCDCRAGRDGVIAQPARP